MHKPSKIILTVKSGILFGLLVLMSVPSAQAQSHPEKKPKRIDILKVEPESFTTGSITPAEETITGSIIRENELLSYCYNVSDAAAEVRSSMLKEKLEAIEEQVDQKLDRLASEIEMLKRWSLKRDQFLKSANDSLVEIFQSMRPDAAALQLTEVGPGLAAAIIAKLEPKTASAILTEMKPTDAATIATVLTKVLETDAN